MTVNRASLMFGSDCNPNTARNVNCIRLSADVIFVLKEILNIASNIRNFSLKYKSLIKVLSNECAERVLFKKKCVCASCKDVLGKLDFPIPRSLHPAYISTEI
jgi:hypothetical protein